MSLRNFRQQHQFLAPELIQKLTFLQSNTVIFAYNALVINWKHHSISMNTTNYQQLIECESIRIKELETELARHRALLKALTALSSEPSVDQKPDIAVELPLSSLPESTTDNRRVPAYVRKETIPLLRAIKDHALSADAIVAACRQDGFAIDRTTVLLRLGLYRRNYSMVKKVRPGLYQLTEKGQRYMAEHYPETTSVAIHRKTGNIQIKSQLPEVFLWREE